MCTMLLLFGGMVHAASSRVGLCLGKISETGMSKTGKGRVSAAVIIPSSELKKYEGAAIKQIRIGLATADGISNLQGWVRKELTGTDLCTAGLDNIQKGWNTADFSGNVTIDSSSDLVIGYSFDQDKSVACMAVGGIDDENGCWNALGDNWQNRSNMCGGSLCIEIVVEGDMVPEKNLAIISAVADNNVIKKNSNMHVACVVRNTSSASDVEGYKCTYSVGDKSFGELQSSKTLKYGEEDTLSIDLPTGELTTDEKLNLNIAVSTPGDGYIDDNTASISFSVYENSIERTVLLEEFTSEECANCPRAIETIAQCMEEGYSKHVVQITHHVGYKDDWLTVDEDRNYIWFYGEGGSFAPAGMLDRTQNDKFDSDVPVFSIAYPDTFRPMLDEAISVPAFVSVDQSLAYDKASRKMDVTVDLHKLPQLDILCPNARLTLIIIEDSILAKHQAGYNSPTFHHRHVYRKCLSDIWGDEISWNNNDATVFYSFELPKEWNEQNIETIAFVSEYDADDYNSCKVFNSCKSSLKGIASSVNSIETGSKIKAVKYYDLSGRTVAEPSKGMFIKAVTYDNGTTKATKLIKK